MQAANLGLLSSVGYVVLNQAGRFVLALQGEQIVLLEWTGSDWSLRG